MRHHPFVRPLFALALVLLTVAAWPSAAEAQRRGPRGGGRVVIVGRGGYSPLYYDPWYFGVSPWYQYGQYGPYGPYGYPPYGRYGTFDDLTSAVRLEVTPRAAEVFVDGYRAGTVDDFDGVLQRLHVRPGEHELVLYLEGYRTVHQKVLLSRGSDQRIRYTMVPLPAGERAEPRPEPPPPPPPDDQQMPEPARPRAGGPQQRTLPAPPSRDVPREDGRFGSVSIRVQPADGDVLIDGEKWSAPATQDRLVVQLSEGRHHVDVQKDGFEKYSSDVQIRRGETITLNISLLRREER